MPSELEQQFHEQMLGIYQQAGRAIGYWPSYFLRAVRKHGGLAYARRLLNDFKGVSAGFKRLAAAGKLNIAMEALVVAEPWSALFSPAERAIAQQRLDDYNPLNTKSNATGNA